MNQHSASVPLTVHANDRRSAGVALEGGDGRPKIESLYIHTPFCVHKCHYCDFYSFVDTRDQQEAFVNRLIEELRVLAPHAGTLKTIFVGGGTPSLLRVDLWERVLATLDKFFDLGAIRRPWQAEHSDPWKAFACGEFTVECNPESATPELMRVLKAGGVNRVSVGAQSFIDKHLKTLERWHNPANVAKAIEAARNAGIERQSLDLIFGIPGQTLEEWESDLQRGLEMDTTHISCYALTYEPNTAMTKRLSLGEITPIDEDVEAEMFRHTVTTLRSAGLDRYEVSNFAVPGYESRHNIAYWKQDQWLAAGPSASGHVWGGPTMRSGSWRFKNVPRLGDYLASSGFSPVVDLESPDPRRLVQERIMMGLRLAAGLESQPIIEDLGRIDPTGADRLLHVVDTYVESGDIDDADHRWALTDAGFLMCDAIAGEMMQAVAKNAE